MLYDHNPAYPHYDALPYAKEPWKALYVFQRLFTTLALVPVWVLKYSFMPRELRPRKSWSLRQIINVNFTRRIYKVTEVAGVTWGTRDPTVAPDTTTLRETRFIWADPLPVSMRTGIVEGGGVKFKRVGCYVWPKEEPTVFAEPVASSDSKDASPASVSSGDSVKVLTSKNQGSDEGGEIPLVGIFMHGGGYCHMSAHEASRTSRIPRGLTKVRVSFPAIQQAKLTSPLRTRFSMKSIPLSTDYSKWLHYQPWFKMRLQSMPTLYNNKN